MLYKKHIQINAFLIIIVLGLISFSSYAKGNDDAIQLFKQKKYQTALPKFNTLRQSNPDDPALCYFSGVCLTETNQFSYETIKLLLKATSSNQPNDVYFFLGKNYHALNDFKTARSYYILYNQNAAKKEIKAFDTNTKIDLCDRKINPFPHFQETQVSNQSLSNKQGNVNQPEDISLMNSNNSDSAHIDETPLEIPGSLNEALINFILTSEIYYSRFYQFRTYKGKLNFIKGWDCADTLRHLIYETDSLRNEYGKTFSTEIKAQVSAKVIDLENQILKKKLLSDESYIKANESELSFWKQAKEEEKWKLIAQNDSIRKAEELKKIIENTPLIIEDTILLHVSDSIVADTTIFHPVVPLPESVETSQIIFKIQIGAFNGELPESSKKLFKKISALRKIDEYTDDRNYTVYTIGELTNIKDAIKLQDQIRQESVKDAFVIAIKDGKRIPLNEALDSKK